MTYNPRVGFIGQELPPLVRRQSIAQLLAARRASYRARNGEWIDDPSDPASEVIDAVADVEYRVMQRFNVGALQLSAATADGGNLDVLAGNVGLVRLPAESDDALRARVAASRLAANIATMPALLAACLTRPGILDVYAPRPANGQDFAVSVRTDTEVAGAAADLQAWLNDADRALAGWGYTVTEAARTRIYGHLAVTYDSSVVGLPGLRSGLAAAVVGYLGVGRINAAAHINRLVGLAVGLGALTATVTLGLAAGSLASSDLPALPAGYYYVQDADTDITYAFQDVT